MEGLLMEKKPNYFYKKECFLDDILVDTNLFLSPHEIIAQAALTSFFPALSATTETSSLTVEYLAFWVAPRRQPGVSLPPLSHHSS